MTHTVHPHGIVFNPVGQILPRGSMHFHYLPLSAPMLVELITVMNAGSLDHVVACGRSILLGVADADETDSC